MCKCIAIIDRDGVINRSNKTDDDRGPFILKIEDFEFLPGAIEGIRLLTEAGYICTILTSQDCIKSGLISKDELDRIHDHMISKIEEGGGSIKHIEVVYPDDDDDSNVVGKAVSKYIGIRKIMDMFGISLDDECWSIGDSPWDLMAGSILGHRTIQVNVKNYTEDCGADYRVDNLKEAAHIILGMERYFTTKYDSVDNPIKLSDRYGHTIKVINTIEDMIDDATIIANGLDGRIGQCDDLVMTHIANVLGNIGGNVRKIQSRLVEILEP